MLTFMYYFVEKTASGFLHGKIKKTIGFFYFARRRTQAVRERSAKPLCISSILIGAF